MHELDIIDHSSSPDLSLDVAVVVTDNVGVRYVTIVSLMSVTPAPSQGHGTRDQFQLQPTHGDSVHTGNWQVE